MVSPGGHPHLTLKFCDLSLMMKHLSDRVGPWSAAGRRLRRLKRVMYSGVLWMMFFLDGPVGVQEKG